MKKALSAFVLVLATLTTAAPAAHATPGACVSRGELRRVHPGMTRHHVHRIFDTRGRRISFHRHGRFTAELRRYRGCAHHTRVSITYVNGRLRTKSASWD